VRIQLLLFHAHHRAAWKHYSAEQSLGTGIRQRTNQLPRSKTERRRSNSWAFFQLRMFILYKGIKFGVAVHLVDPRYTSKTCHRCKVLGDRQGKKFSCLNLACGWVGDADLKGANNISDLGALINCPGGSSTMFCSVQDVVLRATENPILKGGSPVEYSTRRHSARTQ